MHTEQVHALLRLKGCLIQLHQVVAQTIQSTRTNQTADMTDPDTCSTLKSQRSVLPHHPNGETGLGPPPTSSLYQKPKYGVWPTSLRSNGDRPTPGGLRTPLREPSAPPGFRRSGPSHLRSRDGCPVHQSPLPPPGSHPAWTRASP